MGPAQGLLRSPPPEGSLGAGWHAFRLPHLAVGERAPVRAVWTSSWGWLSSELPLRERGGEALHAAVSVAAHLCLHCVLIIE